jgi:hypothetical protein
MTKQQLHLQVGGAYNTRSTPLAYSMRDFVTCTSLIGFVFQQLLDNIWQHRNKPNNQEWSCIRNQRGCEHKPYNYIQYIHAIDTQTHTRIYIYTYYDYISLYFRPKSNDQRERNACTESPMQDQLAHSGARIIPILWVDSLRYLWSVVYFKVFCLTCHIHSKAPWPYSKGCYSA